MHKTNVGSQRMDPFLVTTFAVVGIICAQILHEFEVLLALFESDARIWRKAISAAVQMVNSKDEAQQLVRAAINIKIPAAQRHLSKKVTCVLFRCSSKCSLSSERNIQG